MAGSVADARRNNLLLRLCFVIDPLIVIAVARYQILEWCLLLTMARNENEVRLLGPMIYLG